ncbi:carboxyltransferase domain-containing protein [Salipiger sp. IMCC34102]|uniref:5-oxoprolinase subunit B family protein n=1 Tax=Salipiger sp. IMCC34102 TaxID=2510647 RepID=UPI00101BDB56|nr:carboxyltransferase domain-containing protein [Salipiger sp. IMCC34102]RYH03524.1 carboxyltransferase domain-containing protein [Salipiger sp. IMCC34102]
MPDPDVPNDTQIAPLGQDGVLVRFGDGATAHPAKARSFGATVRGAGLDGIGEVATSLASTLVRFDPRAVSRATVEVHLRALLATPREIAATESRLWTIPASFGGDDGPQLADAAGLADLSPEAAIAEIAETELSVLTIGFAPGQPYLGHLPERWDLPRQTDLTPRVPEGALVVALRQIVLFANPSPTGWRQVGRTAFRPFRPDRAEPFALRAGDRIRFSPVDARTLRDLGQAPDGLGGAICEGEA